MMKKQKLRRPSLRRDVDCQLSHRLNFTIGDHENTRTLKLAGAKKFSGLLVKGLLLESPGANKYTML
jgi:hypothetical protein